MRIANIPLITAGDMKTTLTSAPVELDHIYGYAVQAVFTGSPAGTVKLQASCDPPTAYATAGATPANWTDVTDSSQAVSGAGSYLPNVIGGFYNWVRIVFTPTTPGSNAGTMNARINIKGA